MNVLRIVILGGLALMAGVQVRDGGLAGATEVRHAEEGKIPSFCNYLSRTENPRVGGSIPCPGTIEPMIYSHFQFQKAATLPASTAYDAMCSVVPRWTRLQSCLSTPRLPAEDRPPSPEGTRLGVTRSQIRR